MNAIDLSDWLIAFTRDDVDYEEDVILKAATMLRLQQSDLHKWHQIQFWLQENRPDVWDDMRRASRA